MNDRSDEPVQAPTIEFPCDYPIKVIADSHPELIESVVMIVADFDPTVTHDKVRHRPSKHGSYTSVTVTMRATGEPQLKAMFEVFKEQSWVRMVL
ncbi:MAG: DUF493 domain-containing protein [Pseudomonadales bacterium]|nr:DUF493 domain-containing protein [Pseudomonadales bacterium]